MLDNVDEIIFSVSEADEVLAKLREKCSIAEEIISNAEQEAITIVTEAAKRTEAMTNEAEERVKAANKEIVDLMNEKQKQIEVMKKEREDWGEEKKRIASTHAFGPMVKLDIGGQLFTTATATLTRFPDTMLGAMFSGRQRSSRTKTGRTASIAMDVISTRS